MNSGRDSDSYVASVKSLYENENEDEDKKMQGDLSHSDEEEEETDDDNHEKVEEDDFATESCDPETDDGIHIDDDDREDEDDVVEVEDGKEDNEESDETEEIKNTDEEEEEEEEEVIEEEGEKKYKTIFGKPQNPNLLTIINWRNKGYPFVRFISKDIPPLEFDMWKKKDRDTVHGLIQSPMKGSVWRVLCKEEVKTKDIPKQKKTRRSCAPGFTLPSDEEEESSKTSSAKNDTMVKCRGKKPPKKTSVKKVKAGSGGVNKKSTAPKTTKTKKAVPKMSSEAPPGKTKKKTAETCKTATKNKGTGKKTSASPDKGKVFVMDRDDDDEDSLDFDNIKDAAEAMEEFGKDARTKKPLVISVSPVFHNVADGYSYYVVTFPRGNTTFYFKAECAKSLIDLAYNRRKLLNPKEDGTWIETIASINLRAVEFGEESRWLKTSSNNTVDVTQFIHAVPIGEEEDFLPTLKAKIKYFFDVTHERKTNITGKLVLKYCIGRPQGRTGGLGKFCLNKGTTHKGTAKEVVSEEKTADVMTKELHDHYRDGYTLQYDVPLNKFMVDYDIKEFIMNYVGGNSWDDLSQEDKRKCYRDYPKKSLPDWDAIEQERY